VAHHGLSQWNGVAIVSRVGLEDVRSASTASPGGVSPPRARPAPSGRSATAYACGRSTCPTAAPSTTRTSATS
jgi:exodeoxyribonuclease-3